MNELILLAYCITTGSAALGALRFGKEGLIGFICVQVILVNLFVSKQITLFGYTATAADALAVGITLSLNILQEYYSRETALSAIWISFYCALFYAVLSLFHLAYIPAATDTTHSLYKTLLLPMPRIVIASLVTYLLIQYLDTQIYFMLKKKLEGHYFVLRNYGSLFFSQFLDTVLFTFLGLYGSSESLSNFSTLFDIIKVSSIIKAVVIIVTVPYVRFARTFIKDI
jgi:queuosine precursor transporter